MKKTYVEQTIHLHVTNALLAVKQSIVVDLSNAVDVVLANVCVPPTTGVLGIERKRLRSVFVFTSATAKRMGVNVEEELKKHVGDRISRFVVVFASPFVSADQTAKMRASFAKLIKSKFSITFEDVRFEFGIVRSRTALHDI